MSPLRNMKKQMIASLAALSLVLSACTTEPSGTPIASSSSSESKLNFYKDPSGDFSFSYPKILSLSTDNDVITVSHAMPYPHPDPCDFKDGATIPNLTDFFVTIQKKDGSMIDVIADTLRWTQEDKDRSIFNGEILVPESGLERAQFAYFKGYMIHQGVEGCGQTVFFLQKDATSPVLVVTSKLITEFSDIITASDEYKKLPGVILPEQEEQMFHDIMQSMK